MKRTYKTPSILIVKLASKQAMLESSLPMDSGKTINEEANGSWVKSDRSSSRYDVWDDDWSN